MGAGLADPDAAPQLHSAALARALEARRGVGEARCRRRLEGPQGVHVRVDGRRCINFCGNDYLGLAAHPALSEAWRIGAERYGVGAGASHLVCGHTQAHRQLEEELAEALGRARALLFPSGYMANIGIIASLVGRGDGVYLDRLNHASLIAGARVSGARLHRFAHNDPASLARALARGDERRRLVAVEGVFGMQGDLASLPELATQAQRRRAALLVDDAHGFGVLGETGGGVVEHFGLDAQAAPLLMATLGKALGVAGAFVAGDEEWIEYLLQSASAYIHTTASPPAQAEAARAALRLMRAEPERRRALHASIARFRAEAQRLGLPLVDSATPIQPLMMGSAARAVTWSEELWRRGLWVAAIRRPTVPPGGERLRITLSAAHDAADIDRLLEALAQIQRQMPS